MADQSDVTSTSGQSPGAAPFRKSLVSRFRRDQNGATAVEFGMVALPFFMLMFAIIETALMLWTSQVLEDGLTTTSRTLLTGESAAIYSNPATRTDQFKTQVCANAGSLVDCSKLVIDVRSYASFASAQAGTAAASPVSGGALNTGGFGYTQPTGGQIVVVRAVLDYSIIIPTWNAGLVNLTNGHRAIVAATTFQIRTVLGIPCD